MITYEEALETVLSTASPNKTTSIPLHQAIGQVLAVDIIADRDFPPFNRVAMDGIAINYEGYQKGNREFIIQETVGAGEPKATLQNTSHCIEIMTGAVLPDNCDTVIRYEDLDKKEDRFEIMIDLKQGINIHNQGKDLEKGSVVLQKGKQIQSMDINAMASVGISQVKVFAKPKCAILSSGNELVPIESIPLPHQIRQSNNHMILSTLQQLGVHCDIFHLADDKEIIRNRLQVILNDYDAIIMSGGVSMGKYDYIPQVLEELSCKMLFHKVSQRPGKPFWFGTFGLKPIFAFPGNPVSTLSCFTVYFMPWLRASLGLDSIYGFPVQLANDVDFRPPLTYFAQAVITVNQKGVNVGQVPPRRGSGNIVYPTTMDGIVILPKGKDRYEKGEVYHFLPYSKPLQ